VQAQQCVQLTSTNRPIDLTTFLRCFVPHLAARGAALIAALENSAERLCLGQALVTAFLKIHPGADTDLATPVPIPNTVVKQIGPMVLAYAERVGSCRGIDCECPWSRDKRVATGAPFS
jgi:hypothetical protein